ncbi:MAG: hypothetical protein HUK40_24150 [Desulfobacter sp.]|nr:hypothetical protein [Desulfobacter sp.]WDP86833.1 MAG: hypothetical protein HUN05_18305 [Desulfobacter sp.]
MIYEKKQNNDVAQKILPASNQHPEGWQCKQMVSSVQRINLTTAEAYEPAE